MATVLLVDLSLSLLQRIEELSRKELMQSGLLHFIELIETHQPLEHVCLITFSSTAQIVIPFTKNYSILKSAIYGSEMKLKDKAITIQGIKFSIDYINSLFASDLSSQIILVTDGSPSAEEDILNMNIPFYIKVHVISFGFYYEINTELYKQFTSNTGGTFQFIELPQNIAIFKNSFDNLFNTTYTKYKGILSCSNLNSEIELYPNPNLFNFQLLFKEKDLSSIASSFPKIISIIGFMSIKKIPSPPSLSRHFIVPPQTGSQLCLLLNESLKTEKITALVMFSKDWYGLIHSHIEKEKTSLVLSIFEPHFQISWIGPFSQLTETLSRKDPQILIPFRSVNNPSYYNAPDRASNLIFNPDLTIQNCFQKIERSIKNLPQKKQTLLTECEKLRNIAVIYFLPDVMKILKDVLKKELGEPLNPLSKNIINGFIHQIEVNQFNSQFTLMEQPPSQPSSSKSAMNIHNLIN